MPAGNDLTTCLKTLCDHPLGNYRGLATIASKRLAVAAQQELPQLDEKLFLNLFAATPSAPSKPVGSALTIPSPNQAQPESIPASGSFTPRSRPGPVRLSQRSGRGHLASLPTRLTRSNHLRSQSPSQRRGQSRSKRRYPILISLHRTTHPHQPFSNV